jgi:two-component system cell cycle sensor histidine kinase/response regulator CckA
MPSSRSSSLDAARRALAESEARCKRMEHELRTARRELDRFFSLAYDPFCIVANKRFVRVNAAFANAIGYTEDELVAADPLQIMHPDDVELTLREGEKLRRGEPLVRLTTRYHVRAGGMRWFDWTAVSDPDSGFIYGCGRDITQERELQERLAHAQKLEAIGQLAGGIAHDFNNILSVIRGGAELLRADLRPDDPLYTDAGEIMAAAERAASLTRQLLAFSSRQVLQPAVLDVNERVAATAQLLGRVIGEDIELGLRLAAAPMLVKADPTQIEQVLINLAVNAREAMPNGGRLAIETSAVDLQADDARAYGDLGLAPGAYVLLAMTDTGRGMPPDVLAHVFEPFFTTKPEGRGAGLGLATAYGIVKQSGGSIWVYSEVGLGTTFKIYLPRCAPAPSAPARETAAAGHGETILLVEDEPMVRHLVQRVLQRAGFEVLAASNGGDALVMFEQHRGTVHLLLTDVVMPRIDGRQLAERLLAANPALRVVFMSGYTEDAIIHQGIIDHHVDFVSKPISPQDLVAKLRDVLDRG